MLFASCIFAGWGRAALPDAEPERIGGNSRKPVVEGPSEAMALFKRARVLNSEKDYEGAEKLYKQALATDPKCAPALFGYANLLRAERKDYDGAEELLARAIAADPTFVPALNSYGSLLADHRKDYDAAEKLYRQALDANPTFTPALNNYALLLTNHRKDLDKAEELYKRAIELDPKGSIALNNYANLLWGHRKDHEGAERLYRRALDAGPQNADALQSYGGFLMDRGDYVNAEKLMRRAIAMDPEGAWCHGCLAILLERTGTADEEADASFRKAVELDGADPLLRGNYAHFLLGRGRRPEGLAALDEAFERFVPDADKDGQANCWFYAYCFRPQPDQGQALARLKALLVTANARAEGWDLSRVVSQAVKDSHPDAAWLHRLAEVINGKAKPLDLDGWPAWAAIELDE